MAKEKKGRTTFTRKPTSVIMRLGYIPSRVVDNKRTWKARVVFGLSCGHSARRTVALEGDHPIWPKRLKCHECWQAMLHLANGQPPWSRVPTDVSRTGEIKQAVEKNLSHG